MKSPYKFEWVIEPPLNAIYNSVLKSDNGFPAATVTLDNSSAFAIDHYQDLQVVPKVINCKDGTYVSDQYVNKEVHSSYSSSKKDMSLSKRFNLERLKMHMTSQQNNGNKFQLALFLAYEHNGNIITIDCLFSKPITVYSHRNLLPCDTIADHEK